MDARSRFYALAVSAALVMAAGALPIDDAMAQAAGVAADEAVQVDEAPAQTAEAAAPADDLAGQDEVVEQPVPKQKPAVAQRPAKADLNQTAVRAAPVTRSPRPTRASTRAVALPKILGSYR